MRPPRDRRPGSRRPRARLTTWAARAALLFGGITLALRFATPHPAPEPGGPSTVASDASGRGPPGTPPSAAARASGHETQDMSGIVMGSVVAGLFTVALSAALGMVWLGSLFQSWQSQALPAYTAQQTTRVQPPAPNMQADPLGDIARQRHTEEMLLTTYGWIDEARTHARIPINRAMPLVVGKSLDAAP